MKTVFDKTTREGLIERIRTLDENSTAQWGNMNIYQMLRHCTHYEEMMLGSNKYKRALIGRLFGRMALKEFTRDESPIKRNVPTLPELKVRDRHGDVAGEKAKWVTLLETYAQPSNTEIIHSFFGRLTREQVGQLAYKHTDHHLRQFRVP